MIQKPHFLAGSKNGPYMVGGFSSLFGYYGYGDHEFQHRFDDRTFLSRNTSLQKYEKALKSTKNDKIWKNYKILSFFHFLGNFDMKKCIFDV
jgi:hypothetical protein